MEEEKVVRTEAEAMKDLVIINHKNKTYGREQKKIKRRNKKARS